MLLHKSDETFIKGFLLYFSMFKEFVVSLCTLVLGCSLYTQSLKNINIFNKIKVPYVGNLFYDVKNEGTNVSANVNLEDYFAVDLDLETDANGKDVKINDLTVGGYNISDLEFRKQDRSLMLRVDKFFDKTKFMDEYNMKGYFEYKKDSIDDRFGGFNGVESGHYVGFRVDLSNVRINSEYFKNLFTCKW